MRTRPWLPGMLVAVGPMLAFVAPVSHANPINPVGYLIHIQGVDAGICASPPVQSCDQIVQYTEAEGRLQFDIFIADLFPELPVYSADLDVTWPGAWSLVTWEICGDYQGTVDVIGQTAHVQVSWPDCPSLGAGGLFLVGRLVIDVAGHGVLTVVPGNSQLRMGCPPATDLRYAGEGRAEAGVTCSYSSIPCDFGFPCTPVLESESLAIELGEGEAAVVEINAFIDGINSMCCSQTAVTPSEPWMSAVINCQNNPNAVIDLSIDTRGLAPGVYDGWLRASAWNADCMQIRLTVLGAQGVPEDGPPPGEPQPAPVTWGQLKGLFE